MAVRFETREPKTDICSIFFSALAGASCALTILGALKAKATATANVFKRYVDIMMTLFCVFL